MTVNDTSLNSRNRERKTEENPVDTSCIGKRARKERSHITHPPPRQINITHGTALTGCTEGKETAWLYGSYHLLEELSSSVHLSQKFSSVVSSDGLVIFDWRMMNRALQIRIYRCRSIYTDAWSV